MNIHEYCLLYEVEESRSFAVECFDRYPLSELIKILRTRRVDLHDMRSWKLRDYQHYFDAVTAALVKITDTYIFKLEHYNPEDDQCEHCKKNSETIIDNGLETAWVDIDDKILYVEIDTFEFYGLTNIDINYCPMCGRKL